MTVDWEEIVEQELSRYHDGQARLPAEADPRQRQLTRMGNAANGAGLALLMLGRRDDAAKWFAHAAERWRESFGDAPPDSWGRPIGAIKARLLAGDRPGAAEAAQWALEAGAGDSKSAIGRYAAVLAHLALGRDEKARPLASSLREREDFPNDVADALATLAAGDKPGYILAVESVLESFETREEYLEDVPIADTVLALQALAADRGLEAELSSELLPRGVGM
jgi:hypothetical protein